MQHSKKTINLDEIAPVLALEGITRKTMAYNEDAMLCHFKMDKGASIPLHDHKHAQIGFVIEGEVKFITETGDFIAKTGDSYVFDGFEKHGAELLEESYVIEVFTPCREEYKPEEK